MTDIQRVLIDERRIAHRVSELAEEITREYAGDDLLVVGILKGAFVFMADLIRKIRTPVAIDFMAISSYAGKSSTGVVRILKDLDAAIEGRNVLIIEDIIDSGLTLSYLVKSLQSRKPKSIRIAVLLDKPEKRQTDIQVDYIGFVIPDEFVVGYGLDYDGQYRSLPYVGILGDN